MRSNHNYTFLVITSLVVTGMFHAFSGTVLYQSPTSLLMIPDSDYRVSDYVFIVGVWVTLDVLFSAVVRFYKFAARK